MNETLLEILRSFRLDAAPVSCEPYGCGHINATYLVKTERGRRYILQKINHHTFRDVAGLMENVTSVTDFLRARAHDPRGVLTLVRTTGGASYLHTEDGYWRVCDFAEDTLCLQQPETDEDFYQSAVGFGTFQQLLSDFPAETLHETIPNFHNTPDRYRAFLETLERDPMHRAAQVQPEIEFVLARQAEMGAIQHALDAGELPLRVTHNDTKLNNVLLDAKTRKALCVIDLDTVMPGSSLYDFGDAVRFGAATAAEDETDLSKVELSLDRFRVFTRGYVRACPGLTAKELEMLPMGAKTMTMECGVRFLTDYLDGDHYFAVHRDGQNLDRARTQFRLVADMEKKWDEMQKIVAEEAGRRNIMQYLGIEYSIKNLPALDADFIPFGVWAKAYLKEASRPFKIAVERENGLVSVFETKLRGVEFAEANARFVERFVKMLLWSVGGWRVYLCGDDAVAKRMQDAYRMGGTREFDVGFMQDVYERPFEIVISDEAHFPAAHEQTKKAGGHTNGCRIGFDAGGSDRKVSAVVDGETVYSEEVVWHPKTSEDPQYQYDGIVAAFKTAASKMPRVDGIGVSSAGVFIGNAPMVSSIFLKVPRSRREEVKTIFDRAAKELGDVPIVVANDGDVSALAGSMSLGAGCVMGLAMGTSEAVGYVNHESNLLGWISELAFAPADLNEHAMRDEWSGDLGVGCKYFSQDAVIKLAPAAGIALAESLTPAEKLKEVQKLAEGGHAGALDIFRSIGVYLGHTLCLYEMLYDIRNLIVLGRVASGVGGDLIVAECQRVLSEEYPELSRKLRVMLPDENFRRVGQSMAAASLPEF